MLSAGSSSHFISIRTKIPSSLTALLIVFIPSKGSIMSWTRSKHATKSNFSSSLFETSHWINFKFSETPASFAFFWDFTMLGSNKSNPKNWLFGNFLASSIVDLPDPQPKSAKVTEPCSSLDFNSGISSIQSLTKKCLYLVHPVWSIPSQKPWSILS